MTVINAKAPSVLMVICALGCNSGTRSAASNPDGPPGSADSGWTGMAAGSGGSTGGAGSGGALGGGGTGGGGADLPDGSVRADGAPAEVNLPQCQEPPRYDRACTTVSDCVIALHRSDCCGNEVALGIRSTEQARFNAIEGTCRASIGLCPCPVGPTKTDDGSQVRQPSEIAVACTAGRCTTYRMGCGAPCAAGTTCFDCPEAARTGYYCSIPCTSSEGCAGAPHPICAENVSPRFCAPAICGTRS